MGGQAAKRKKVAAELMRAELMAANPDASPQDLSTMKWHETKRAKKAGKKRTNDAKVATNTGHTIDLDERDTFTLLLLVYLLTCSNATLWQSSTLLCASFFGDEAADLLGRFGLDPSSFNTCMDGSSVEDTKNWMTWGFGNVAMFLSGTNLLTVGVGGEGNVTEWNAPQQKIFLHLLHINDFSPEEGECRSSSVNECRAA